MRRPAPSKATILTCVSSVLAMAIIGPAHLMLVEHTLCPERGEIVPAVTGELGHDHEGKGGPKAPSHSHEDDLCPAALTLRAPGAVQSADVVLVQPTPVALPLVVEAERPVRAPIALLALAPCHSPPAVI